MPTNNPELNKLLAQAGDAYNWLSGFDYPLWLSDLKTILTYISLIFAFLLAVIIFKIRRLAADRIKEELADWKSEFNPPAEAVSAYDRRWEEIKKHVASFNEAEWKLAVIEADKFTDDALKTGGYPGESMGERLMLIQPGQLLSLQNLWDAHKLRNLLVHDANYKLTHRQAVLAVEAFEQVLRELGALS